MAEICTCKRYSDGKLASGCDTSKCPNADHRRLEPPQRLNNPVITNGTEADFLESFGSAMGWTPEMTVDDAVNQAMQRLGLTPEETL